MKLVLNRNEFLSSLLLGGSFAGKKHSMPALDMCKFVIKSSGVLSISSTDTESYITKSMSCVSCDDVPFDGATFCLFTSEVVKVLKTLSCEEVTITIDEEKKSMSMRYGNGEFSLPISEADNYPVHVGGDIYASWAMDASVLRDWVNNAKNFVATDTLRPVLNGLYLYAKNGEVGCCATDAAKLFHDFTQVDVNVEDEQGVILSATCFNPLSLLLMDTDNVSIDVQDKNVEFKTKDVTLSCRRIEGRFPNFRSVIPANNPQELTVSKNALLSAVTRCGIVADSAMAIAINASLAGLTISSENIDFNRKVGEDVEVVANNANIRIGVKAQNLITCLSSITCDNVLLKFNDERTAIVFYDLQSNNKRIITMPLMLNA